MNIQTSSVSLYASLLNGRHVNGMVLSTDGNNAKEKPVLAPELLYLKNRKSKKRMPDAPANYKSDRDDNNVVLVKIMTMVTIAQ